MNYDIKKINHLRNKIQFTYETDIERSNDRLIKSLSNGSGILEKKFYKLNSVAKP